MTPPAALTQEEIAEGERLFAAVCEAHNAYHAGSLLARDTAKLFVKWSRADDTLGHWLISYAPRIFATIRTLQDRVRELEGKLDEHIREIVRSGN